jgi:UDP-N-acetyl-L-fucosamine synthase
MSKLKLVTVLGTRPEIIRLAEIIKAADNNFDHVLVHTGQNYDYELNEIFFKDLGLRKPDYFLKVAGSNLGRTIGNVIAKSFEVFSEERPDALLVLGDTNSVLCTIAAKRLKIPIFHLEAGNRCFDQNVPEEINRKISDHISDINLAYTEHSRRYLIREGIREDHIFVVGTPLFEVLVKNKISLNKSKVLKRLGLEAHRYFVVSIHREENMDIGDNFLELSQALNAVAENYNFPIIFSTHPRTQKQILKKDIKFHSLIRNMPPFGFFDYISLQKNSFCVLSDSGTLSEESAMVGFPAVSIRTSTERPEAIDMGSIVLGGITKTEILSAINIAMNTFHEENLSLPSEYQIKDVSRRVIRLIQSYTGVINRLIWNK